MPELYGLVASIIGVLLLALTVRELYRRRMRVASFLLWSILWVGLIVTGVFPQIYWVAVTHLGMALPIHFITTFSIIILFAISYQLYRTLNEVDKKLTKVVKQLAIESFSSEQKSQEEEKS